MSQTTPKMMSRLRKRKSNYWSFLFLLGCAAPSPKETISQIQNVPESQVLTSPEEVFLRVPMRRFSSPLKISFNGRTPLAQLENDSSIRDYVQVIDVGNPHPQDWHLELKSNSTTLGERTLGYIHPKVWIERPGHKVEALEAKSRKLDMPKERKTPYWVSTYEVSMPQTGAHHFLIATTNRMQNVALEPEQSRWLAVGHLSGEITLTLTPVLPTPKK